MPRISRLSWSIHRRNKTSPQSPNEAAQKTECCRGGIWLCSFYSPAQSSHSFNTNDVVILDREDRWFERGVKEAVWERVEEPSLNKRGGLRFKLSRAWDRAVRGEARRLVMRDWQWSTPTHWHWRKLCEQLKRLTKKKRKSSKRFKSKYNSNTVKQLNILLPRQLKQKYRGRKHSTASNSRPKSAAVAFKSPGSNITQMEGYYSHGILRVTPQR